MTKYKLAQIHVHYINKPRIILTNAEQFQKLCVCVCVCVCVYARA